MAKNLNEALDRFQNLRNDGLQAIIDGKKQGMKVVGTYCTYCPEELILAAGAVPIGLCGTVETPIPAAEEVLPRNLCPMIKSSYGFAATDTCPFFHFADLIIGETTCDGKKKMFELMNEIKPVHVMNLPNIPDGEDSLNLWVAEMRRLRARLEEEFAVTISDEDIWEAIDLVDRERRALKELHDLNQQNPPLLPGTKLLQASWLRTFAVDKRAVIKSTYDLIEAARDSAPATPSRKPRVLLTGCPVGLGSEKVVRLLDELGADMVAMENCIGYKTLELQADRTQEDPLVALAKKYLEIPCSCMSPNPRRLNLLDRMIRNFSVDAVIDLVWQACHTYNIESYSIGKLVREHGLPYLHLESDYSQSDVEVLKVRIEALLEMAES